MPHRVIKFKQVGKTEKTVVGPVSAGRSAQTQTVIIPDFCRFSFCFFILFFFWFRLDDNMDTKL